jgi:hypothetical protein
VMREKTSGQVELLLRLTDCFTAFAFVICSHTQLFHNAYSLQ